MPKGYSPPKPGDRVYISKSFGEWSSNTLVIVAGYEEDDKIEVVHEATKKAFVVPFDILVKKRERG